MPLLLSIMKWKFCTLMRKCPNLMPHYTQTFPNLLFSLTFARSAFFGLYVYQKIPFSISNRNSYQKWIPFVSLVRRSFILWFVSVPYVRSWHRLYIHLWVLQTSRQVLTRSDLFRLVRTRFVMSPSWRMSPGCFPIKHVE